MMESGISRRVFGVLRLDFVFGAFVALQTFVWLAEADRWEVLLSWDLQGWSWVALLWVKNVTLALAAGVLAVRLGDRLTAEPTPASEELSLRHEALWVGALVTAGVAVRWLFWRWVPEGPWVDTVLLVDPVLRNPDVSWLGATPYGYDATWNRELVSHVYARFAGVCFIVFGRGDAGLFAVSAVPGCITPLAIWLLSREAAGPRVAIVAAALASLTRWPVLFSRWAFTGTALVALAALGAWLALRAVRRDSVVTATLSGLCFGLAFHTHSSSWAVVPVFCVLAIAAAWSRPTLRRMVACGLLGTTLAAVPFLIGYLRNPHSLGGRAKDVHVGTRVRDVQVPAVAGSLQIPSRLAYNFVRYTGGILWTSDPTPRHGIPGTASFTPPVGLAAVLGLFVAVRRATRREDSWLVLCALAGGALGAGILSNPEGAPNTLRSCVLVVPSIVGAAFVLERLMSGARRLGIGPFVLAGGGLAFLFVWETLPVLTSWTRFPTVAGSFCGTESLSARLYRSLDGAPLVLEDGVVRFPIVLEVLAGPDDLGTPVRRLPRTTVADLLRVGVRAPVWLLARRGTAEELRRSGARVSRPVAPNEMAPDVVLVRLTPGARSPAAPAEPAPDARPFP